MGATAVGFFGSLSDQAQDALKRKRDAVQKQKDEQAQVYWDAIRSGNLSPDQLTYSQQQLQKLYGNDKPIKELFQKLGQATGLYHKHFGGGQDGQQPQGQPPAKMTPPPSAATAGARDATPATGMNRMGGGGGAGAMTPPPQAAAATATAAPANMTPPPSFASVVGSAFPSDATKEERKFQNWKRMQDIEHQDRIEEIEDEWKLRAKAAGIKPPVPKSIHYAGPDGKPLFGWAVGEQLYDQEMYPLPPDTQVFSAWMAPRTTTTEGFKEVQQTDGSIVLVPVETQSVTTRGGGTATQGAGTAAPSKPTATVKPGAKTVGGKILPTVAKAYDAYNAAQERFAVMQDAMPRALKGDQQAMLNLLANHIGMTMGLQKGARITQAIYEEAAQSAPWLQRVEAHFDSQGYLTGVVLTPAQMSQMIELAKVRLGQDEAAWQREVEGAKSGYGMKGTPKPTKAPPKLTAPPTAAPRTADDYLKGLQANP